MRRSLGDKRRKIGEKEDGRDQLAEVVKIYGRLEESEVSRVFANAAFGYTRVTVDRPLRLNFQASPDRIARLQEETAFLNLARSKKKGPAAAKEIEQGRELQETILKMLGSIPHEVYTSQTEFLRVLDEAVEDSARKFDRPIKFDGALRKAILSALSERDERAEVCTDAKGRIEADAELRDFENVPLGEDIDAYFEREVLPHVQDAWMERSKDKIGYEINFNRHFYKYTPPRPLEEIDADLKKAEEEIMKLLLEVTD